MGAVLLIPVLLSALLMAAHFLRADHLVLVVVSVIAPLLLFFRRCWATRLLQVLLFLGALEYLRYTIQIYNERIEQGRDWKRFVVIMGSVALWIFLSSLIFFIPFMRRHYCPKGHSAAEVKDAR
jgi:uncharacterized membrane-anchored protein